MPIFSFKVYTFALHYVCYLLLALIGRLEIHFNHEVILILHLTLPLPGQLIRVTRERLYCVPEAEHGKLTRLVLLSGIQSMAYSQV